MKRLLILTAMLMLLIGAAGCQCWNWCSRGAAYPPCPPAVTYGCCPPAMPCDSCAGAPAIAPGPAPYTAIPGP